MKWQRVLKARRDVNDDDIPEILERAIVHQSHVQESQTGRIDINDIHRLAEELNIEEEFIDLAVEDLRRERQEQVNIQRVNTQRRNRLFERIFNSFSTSLGLGIGLLIVVLMGVLATRWLQSLPPPIRKETIIQRTIIETPIVVESKKSDGEGESETVSTEEPPQQKIPPILPSVNPPKNVTDEIPSKIEMSKEQDGIDDTPSQDAGSLQAELQGNWELKYYWLYEEGSEQPIGVPVTIEPLELPKSFTFTKDRFTRALSRDLSFSAKYQFRELPENYRYSDLSGEWALLEAIGVVASIGIRRPHDYYIVNLDGDYLTIWYLGADYPASKPAQGEQYHRAE